MGKSKEVFTPFQSGYRVDWLRYTVPFETGIKYVLPDGIVSREEPTQKTGILGYTSQLITKDGYRVAWSPERHDMGIMVDISGSALNEPDFSGYTISPDLAIRHMDGCGGHLTRIDYAIDIVDEEKYSTAAFQKLIMSGGLWFAGKKIKPIVELEHDGKRWERKSHTLNLGERSSDRCLRCYDKAAERKILGVSWTRIELELKHKRADALGKAASKGNAGEYGRILGGEMLSYLKAKKDTARGFFERLEAIVGTSQEFKLGRKQKNNLEFLDNVIVPFLGKNLPVIPIEKVESLIALLTNEVHCRNQND